MSKKNLNLLLFIIIFNVSGCERNKNIIEPPAYRAGDYKEILTSGPENNIFKGMIYEYGIGVDVDISKARNYYKQTPPAIIGKKREFLLCFIHCTSEIEDLYNHVENKYPGVDILYAIDLTLKKKNCESEVKNKFCSQAESFVQEYFSKSEDTSDFYYHVGKEINEKLLDRDVGNFKRLEIPYYFLKKSSIEGNDEAQEYLNSLIPQESWVPTENWIKLLKGNIDKT